MPELWELCNPESIAILGFLFNQEQGYYPDWDERSGKAARKNPVTISPEIEDMELDEIDKFMRRSPKHPRKIG